MTIIKDTPPEADQENYLALTQAQFVSSSLQSRGFWYGRGARALGLAGEVDRTQFQHLLNGKSPDGRACLRQNGASNEPVQKSGWHFTLKTPISVSLLWSQSSSVVREKIENVYRATVKRCLDMLEESNMGTLPLQLRPSQTGWVFAVFERGISSYKGPCLHTRVVQVNLAVHANGTTRALEEREFLNEQSLNVSFHGLCIFELMGKMELAGAMPRGRFELANVPLDLIQEFRKRQSKIDSKLRMNTVENGAIAKQSNEAYTSKHEAYSRQLFSVWQEIGDSFGWGPNQARSLVEQADAKRTKQWVGFMAERAHNEASKLEKKELPAKVQETIKIIRTR